jgi:hypothetical protein
VVTNRILANNVIMISGDEKEIQPVLITGKVTDLITGKSLPGVSVVIEDSQEGIITDDDGNYTLEAPDQNQVIVFSYTGYVTKNNLYRANSHGCNA